jgi:hypothetical protein
MISDQRSHYRVSFFLGGDIYKTVDGERIGRAIIRDVSFSGMRIETLEPLEQGETVYLDFEVGGRFRFPKVPLMVARLYRHTGSYLIGLTFQRGEDKRRVRQALAFMIESSS